MRGQLQLTEFSVNTAVLHAPLAYWHACSERGIENSISKIPLKLSQSDSFGL